MLSGKVPLRELACTCAIHKLPLWKKALARVIVMVAQTGEIRSVNVCGYGTLYINIGEHPSLLSSVFLPFISNDNLYAYKTWPGMQASVTSGDLIFAISSHKNRLHLVSAGVLISNYINTGVRVVQTGDSPWSVVSPVRRSSYGTRRILCPLHLRKVRSRSR